jgi:hypothetical protein
MPLPAELSGLGDPTRSLRSSQHNFSGLNGLSEPLQHGKLAVHRGRLTLKNKTRMETHMEFYKVMGVSAWLL